MKWSGWLGVVLVVLLAGVFAYLNAGERVTVHLGVVSIYRLSLPGLVFGVFLLGMVTMFLFGLRQDLRIRRALRQTRSEPPPTSPPGRPPPPPTWEAEAPPDATA